MNRHHNPNLQNQLHDHLREFGPAAGMHHHEPGGRGRGFGGFGPGMPGGFDFGAAFGAGFGGPRGRRAGKGDIRTAILSLLADGPSNGYGLIKAIAEKTDGAWRPSPGSVYPTLQQLVDEELIVSNGDSRKTEFQLTDAGRSYVEEHAGEFDKAWDATPRRTESGVALFESAGKLMSVLGQFRHGATDEQRKAAIEKLDETRRALYLILAD